MHNGRLLPQVRFFAFAIILGMMFMPRISFAATSLSASPTSFNFGSKPVNSGYYFNETLTNRGTTTVTITQATMTSAFKTDGLTLPLTLTSGKSVTFRIKFVPKTAGNFTGSLQVVSNAPTINIALTGTGLAAGTLSISPTSFSFGSVTVGSSATKTATLKANTSSVYIPAATTTNPEFTLSGFTLPLTLAAGQSVNMTVKFAPKSSGSTSATISLSNTKGPTTASASGTGAATTQHRVGLTWSPSKSTVTGYNIYRGTTSGGPYSKLNSQSVVSTSYTDSSISSGKTYFYVTTAVSSSGAESIKSNEVRAAIPTP
jgi:Abnormal spindle-like microcephaly-assoc'd, ASPM-SPD-2-Hydin